ncbi:protein EDS1L [Andrographis paniculata]|uniref:protein EDS1L n=1 Tax=Andrographis paniculata TaxID=175694 RepID=UPI0021E85F15|nr:protein EDS1L [Andrographis paniculata]
MNSCRLGDNLGINEDLIHRACKLSLKAHLAGKPYLRRATAADAIFAFPGSWAADDWRAQPPPFGEIKVDLSKFGSIKSLGNNEVGLVNEAFSKRFDQILAKTSLANEIEKAMSDRKRIVFTGHSLGGSTAILTTIWFFEKFIRHGLYHIRPDCITFGAPLVGNYIFSHALRRENWSRNFTHFITKYDIVPRIALAPFPAIEPWLQHVLDSINPRSPHPPDPTAASNFFVSVLRNALAVASHTACYLKGSTSLLLENVAGIVEISPYRPFGTVVICAGNGKLVVIDNPDAALQLLFYCLQLSPEEMNEEFVKGMYGEHLVYERELQESLSMQDVTFLSNLADVPLSPDDPSGGDATALNYLGLTTRARLCLRAAGEFEKQKLENQKRIDSNKETIREAIKKIQEYKTSCEIRKVGYYDAFKLTKSPTDFNANVKRLELAGIWDEIMEMIKRHELPDGFEGRKEWIELGTLFRRLLEPLDIANYYRHVKNEDTGPYMVKGRPKRYKFTQRWLEHAQRMADGFSSEATFWAEVEELRLKDYKHVRDKVLRFEQQVSTWVGFGWLGQDVFLDETTFTRWWKTLPFEHKSGSCLARFMNTT